ncbi:hypothetical protein [Actinacidiphila sp. ITFR-21]|uniref:hypothetical protein n=1 Tax=Actinacidiphila sp. ITFR-21 TaxID=3075199 RepID=UPI00288BCF6F|nr:hypothetical protein [Streptomyces sp. ITFR-21]WNI18821.1 hypothetical protein RLT57_27035 [Streptomyces sp. ITFR-21]
MTFEVISVELSDGEGPSPATRELPIVDYNHLPKLAIEGFSHDLAKEEVETVLRYERAHRSRTPVIRVLTARLRRLRDGRHPDGAPVS